MTTSDHDEHRRIDEDTRRVRNWRRWGPYLPERQWGTVREDYSAWGECWDYLPHDHARSRVYRWGEDGLLGICDRQCRICFSLALWNGRDPILKERLFGLTGPEGNHAEDVKELYYYLDATPTSSYLKALYKYPHEAYPYAELVAENRRRTKDDREYEIEDTGVFDRGYWDVFAEYAKDGPDDILIRITVVNRGPQTETLHLLPTVWLRNTWSWGRHGEGYDPRGSIEHVGAAAVRVSQPTLGHYRLDCDTHHATPELLFTDNETNSERLWNVPNAHRYTKDAFHRRVVDGDVHAVNPAFTGTKCAAWYRFEVPAGGVHVTRLRLTMEGHESAEPFGGSKFDAIMTRRIEEANHYHGTVRNTPMTPDERRIVRQADAGLVWSRKFYCYIVEHWMEGDPAQPPPPDQRKRGRNRGWENLWARDVIALPDAWEYPWFAAWDLAFHCVAMARFDPHFAKQQLLLLSREWYMHPNGQLPAYEFAFSDVNPPVHAWAVWRVYQLSAEAGHGKDREFLERAFDKCLINFTWWVNREDAEGDNLFTGGFLGLDNVGVFDRSQPLPGGGVLVQADATAWMAFYCTTMIAMAVELAKAEPPYGDLALKFFEHFVAIAKATNELGGSGLWSETDGFYYDQMQTARGARKIKLRSMVGLVPLFAVATLDDEQLRQLPEFQERLAWFFANRPQLARAIAVTLDVEHQHRLLAIPNRERLERMLQKMLDENELLSPFGVRSLSKAHETPYVIELDGQRYTVEYAPGESRSGTFGGNSNWRGPVWFPVNYLLIEALKRYHHFYGDELTVECPTGSGVRMNLAEVAEEIERRLVSLFLPSASGHRPCHGAAARYADDPAFRELVLFYEYFDGDTGRGCGASHQTGWTALAANLIERCAQQRIGKQTP
ncbi:MAG TPA: glucosidase [Kofleriaceae bacterium]|nr:glucosidase [Kofleriaceae bacterium]